MPTINSQWFHDQMAAQDLTFRELAKRVKLDAGALCNTVNGKRKMSLRDAAKLAEVFSQPIDVVLAQAGVPTKEVTATAHSVKVLGWVGDGFKVLWGKPKGPGEVAFPAIGAGAAKNVVALRSQTAGTALDSLDGALVFLKAPAMGQAATEKGSSSRVAAELLGKLCVVQIATDGAAKGTWYLGSLKRGYESGLYTLMSLAGQVLKEDVQIASVSPVIWLKM